MPRPRRKSHLAHRRSAAAESTRRHCRFCGESACTVAVAVAASSSGAAAGEEGVQTTPTLGVFPTKCCRPPPRPISHFLSASVFLKRQKQGPGRGEAGPRSRTGSRPAWVSLIPERWWSWPSWGRRWSGGVIDCLCLICELQRQNAPSRSMMDSSANQRAPCLGFLSFLPL